MGAVGGWVFVVDATRGVFRGQVPTYERCRRSDCAAEISEASVRYDPNFLGGCY